MAEPQLQIARTGAALDRPPRLAITFFYYDDLPEAVAFYRELGLRVAMLREWCAICDLAGGARLGLVDGLHGSQRPTMTGDKGAILSLEVDDLEDCLDRCRASGLVSENAKLVVGGGGMTEEFKIRDPGGYSIEFFRWRDDAGLLPRLR